MKSVLIPKTLVHACGVSQPFFFLAGPVRGGGDWQWRCVLEIERQLGAQRSFTVAIPYHDLLNREPNHPAVKFVRRGAEGYFPRQLAWEQHYMDIAMRQGCLLFWLQCQDMNDPRPEGSGPYGQDTYGELGGARKELKYNPAFSVVVGGEAEYHGLSQIKRNFDHDVGYDFPIHSTLEETVAAAIKKVQALIV